MSPQDQSSEPPSIHATESQPEKPKQEPSKWIAICISLLAVGTSAIAAWNSWRQADTGREALDETRSQVLTAIQALETARSQLETARRSQETAEKSYMIAKSTYEQQLAHFAQEESFAIVYDQPFLDSLDSPIPNGQQFRLAFSNKTKRTQSYFISIETEGVSVYWPNVQPTRSQFEIFLDRNPVAVSAEASYTGGFVLWHHQTPAPEAWLRIKVNNRVVLQRNYSYDSASRTYARKGA